MKAKKVSENIEFERGLEPKDSIGLGEARFREPGDRDINDKFMVRGEIDGTKWALAGKPNIFIIRKSDGKKYESSIYEIGAVIRLLKELT